MGVFQEPMEAERLSLGLSPPDYGRASVVIKPNASEVEQLVGEGDQRSVHIFSHIPDDRRIYGVYRMCVQRAIKTGLLAEGRDWRGWRGYLRLLRSAFAERHIRREVGFVLAIGNVGRLWYGKAGYQAGKIYPFCYVVKPNDLRITVDEHEGPVQIVYIGQLIRRKRIDLLIGALATIKRPGWTLTIIGSGDESSRIDDLVRMFMLQSRVDRIGVLPNREVYKKLASADLLVLPSHWDGWGAVINEALHAGVPVVCSNCCGASDAITSAGAGEVFEAGNLNELASCLEGRIAEGSQSNEQRVQLKNWAECLSAPVIADYLLGILEHVAGHAIDIPVAPWRSPIYASRDVGSGMDQRNSMVGGATARSSTALEI